MASPEEQDKVETDTFFRGNHTLRLKDGEDITIPKLSWGREGKVIRCLGQMLAHVPNLKKLVNQKEVSGEDIVAVLPDVLISAPEYLTEMAVYLSGKTKEQVEGFDIQDIVNIIYPFFPRIIKLLSSGEFAKLALQVKLEESPTA